MSDATAILDRLALAHALLSAGRTRFALARDEGGLPVDLAAPEAVQFCLMGALCRANFERSSGGFDCRKADWTAIMLIRPTLDERLGRPESPSRWYDTMASDEDALALLEECAAKINPK